MDQPAYQRIITESELDRAAQQFVEREFPKAVKAVNRFSGKQNPRLNAAVELRVDRIMVAEASADAKNKKGRPHGR